MTRASALTACAAALLLTPAGAGAHSGHGPRLVEANGNPLFGGLAFVPAQVALTVGDAVQWRNRDSLATHTATEDHGLWSVSLKPGETSAPLGFDAGVFTYHCVIHPSMRGTISVPAYAYVDQRPASRPKPRRKKKRPPPRRFKSFVVVRWAAAPPTSGLAFDVERRRTGDAWQRWLTATTATDGEYPVGRKGTMWELRVRLRRAASGTQSSSDWSPTVSVAV